MESGQRTRREQSLITLGLASKVLGVRNTGCHKDIEGALEHQTKICEDVFFVTFFPFALDIERLG